MTLGKIIVMTIIGVTMVFQSNLLVKKGTTIYTSLFEVVLIEVNTTGIYPPHFGGPQKSNEFSFIIFYFKKFRV